MAVMLRRDTGLSSIDLCYCSLMCVVCYLDISMKKSFAMHMFQPGHDLPHVVAYLGVGQQPLLIFRHLIYVLVQVFEYEVEETVLTDHLTHNTSTNITHVHAIASARSASLSVHSCPLCLCLYRTSRNATILVCDSCCNDVTSRSDTASSHDVNFFFIYTGMDMTCVQPHMH